MSIPMMFARRVLVRALLVLGAILGVTAGRSLAADDPPALPQHPRINLATWYEVDPQWPQRPPGMSWGRMPGIAVNDKDEIFLFTRAKPPVQVYDRNGKFLRGWGDDLIDSAHYIKLDSAGNVWVVDVGGHTVMQFTPAGKLLKTLGTRGKPGCDATHFNRPTDVTVTPDGQVFVSDGYGNSRIVHFDASGKFVKQWGTLGVGPGQFSLPHGIALDSQGRLYVCDRNNVRVQVFDQSGKFLAEWRSLLVPWGIWITKSDEIWVCGPSPMPWRKEDELLSCPPKDQLVMKFDPSGRVLQLWTIPKGEDGKERPGEVNWLHAVAPDSQGNLYVGDIRGQRAQKLVRQK